MIEKGKDRVSSTVLLTAWLKRVSSFRHNVSYSVLDRAIKQCAMLRAMLVLDATETRP